MDNGYNIELIYTLWLFNPMNSARSQCVAPMRRPPRSPWDTPRPAAAVRRVAPGDGRSDPEIHGQVEAKSGDLLYLDNGC